MVSATETGKTLGMPVFAVKVPIESVAHETLESRVHADLPDAVLSNGMTLTQQSDKGYVVAVKVPAEPPITAKLEAVRQVELLLQVIALSNDAFRVRIGAVAATSEPDSASEASTGSAGTGYSGLTQIPLRQRRAADPATAGALPPALRDIPRHNPTGRLA